MKIAVCVHLFYTDMFNDIVNYLNNLKHPYDLYVSLVNGFFEQDIINKIKSFKSDVKIIFVENKGVDIGGFLNCLKVIDNDTDLILKLHTKKGIGLPEKPSIPVKRKGMEWSLHSGREWFNGLMRGVLLDEKKVDRIIHKFETDKKCGMVGYKIFNSLNGSENEILKLVDLFGLDNSCLKNNFIGGTMFWVRYSIVKKYFTPEVIEKILTLSPIGYYETPTSMHAVERIFGYIVSKENQEVIVVN